MWVVPPHSWTSEIFKIIVPGGLQMGRLLVSHLKWHLSQQRWSRDDSCYEIEWIPESTSFVLSQQSLPASKIKLFAEYHQSPRHISETTWSRVAWRTVPKATSLHLNSATYSTLILVLSIRPNHLGHTIQTPSLKVYQQIQGRNITYFAGRLFHYTLLYYIAVTNDDDI